MMAVYQGTQFPQFFVLASYHHGQYTASMTREARRLTGCSAVFARTIDGIIASANVQRYRSKSAARRALKRIQGEA